MTKPVKIFLGLAALLVLLAAALLVLLPLVADPNQYKEEIGQAVESKTGRSFTFEGDLSLSVFPWLGVKTGGLRLGESPAFGKGDFASVRGANIHLKLFPLLAGRYELGAVEVEGLSLTLIRDAQGRWNWEDLRRDERRAAEAAKDVEEVEKTVDRQEDGGRPGEPALPALSAHSVRIADAKVLVLDQLTDNRYELSGLNLATGRLDLGAAKPATDLTLSFGLEAAKPALRADVKLTTKATADPAGERVFLDGLSLTAAAQGEDLPGGTADLALNGNVALDGTARTLDLKNMILNAYALSLSGRAAVEGLDAAPSYQGELALAPCAPRRVLDALGIAPPSTADPKALSALSGAFVFQGGTKALTASEVTLDLDGTRLEGALSATDFTKPALSFHLNADTLDLDRYLPPKEDKAAEAKKQAPGKKEPASEDGVISPETRRLLRTLDLDGAVQVRRLTAAGLALENVAVTVKAKDGLIRVHPVEALLYKGKYAGDITTDLRGETAKTSLSMRLESLELRNALHDFLGKDLISGVARLSLDAQGTGEDWKTLARTLTGQGAMSILNGAIEGFQVIPKAVKGHLKDGEQKRKLEKVEKRQEFESITASLYIGQGTLGSRDLALSAGPLTATAKGGLKLLDGGLDGTALVNITALPTIPISIGGSVADPEYGLDEAAFLTETVKGVVAAPLKIGKESLDIGADVLKGIGSGLEQLLGPLKKKPKEQQ